MGAETKPCRACGGVMRLEARPGTRDERWGRSWYCQDPSCEHREWDQKPGGGGKPEGDTPKSDWKIEQYQSREKPGIAQITDQLFLGDLIDAWLVRDQGTGAPFDAILNVGNKDYEPPQDVEYVHIPLTEYGTQPLKRKERERDFAHAVETLNAMLAAGKKVFVHCIAGANRSAAVIMATLMEKGESYTQALNMIRTKRPIAWPHGEIDLTLRRFIQDQGSAKESASGMSGGQYEPLAPIAKRAADDAAEFVAEVQWEKPFESNYRQIEMSDIPLEQEDPGEAFFEPQTPQSERFVRSDILIDQAMGQEHYRSQQYPEAPPTGTRVNTLALSKADSLIVAKVLADPPTLDPNSRLAKALRKYAHLTKEAKPKDRRTPDMFGKGKPEVLTPEEHPRLDIKPPQGKYYELLSKRGLKLPAPEVYASERYQKILNSAPRIPLDPRDPLSVDRSIEFVRNTKGLLMGHKEETAGEYFLCPTEFGSQRTNHVAYASWFSIFSANTAVESEETSFVLWQAGKSGSGPGKPGIMSKKPKIIEWLQFLKWAGFPTFKNLDKTMEGFDTSDESYERRITQLARLPGMQFKVASFFLALLGDTRSPTLDMHAIGYLIEKGSVNLDQGQDWTPLSQLAEMAKKLKEINRQIGTGNYEYRQLRVQYDELAEKNKDIIMKMTGSLSINKVPPKTQKGMEGERKKVREYMRRQMEGWNGETNKFWLWYAQNQFFPTHEPRRDMIHTVFFQSLFPELFTPEQLASRDELFQRYSDPENIEEREDRMRYRDYEENLTRMRQIQPHKVPVVTAPTDAKVPFDWDAGNFKLTPSAPAKAPAKAKPAPKVKKDVKKEEAA